MRAGEIAFVGALVFECRWFEEALQEHIDFYDGLLPHLFVADVERWAEGELQSGGSESVRLSAVLKRLEAGMGAGPDVAELVSVSFLENLPRPGDAGAELRTLVGPLCAAQLAVTG